MSATRDRINTFFKYKDLLRELVVRDVKLKYRRSFLGYVWSILNPLLIMLVMTLVFSQMFQRGIENFPVYLLTGQALFDFMNNATHMSMYSVLDNGALIKKIYVPMGALILVMLITRAPFSPYLLLFPLVVIPLYIFVCGMGFFLSAANVFFRDIQYIYNAITVAWMYVTPMFYPIDLLPDWLRTLVEYCNPMYYYIQFFRDLVLYRHFTTPRIFVGCWLMAFVMLAIGMAVFKKTQDKFILYI